MAHLDEQTLHKLRAEYLELVKQSIRFQKAHDIKSFTKNALQAENVAQQFQTLSKNK